MNKAELAENPNTPIYILEELYKEEDFWVRSCVASNPNTPKEMNIGTFV